jgi:hypothetical protein
VPKVVVIIIVRVGQAKALLAKWRAELLAKKKPPAPPTSIGR